MKSGVGIIGGMPDGQREERSVRRHRQVAVLQALGNERRLRVLEALMAGEQSVGALVSAIGLPQNQVSTALSHFSVLGLVQRRREGRRVFYALRDATVGALLDTVFGLAATTGRPPASA